MGLSSLFQKVKLPLLVFLLATFFIISLEFLHPNFFLHNDNSSIFLPSFIYNWRSVIERGEIPLINFHQHLGSTYLGQGYSAVLYPPVYIAIGLSTLISGHPYYAIDLLVYVHLALSSVATFFLLRKLSINNALSVIGGLLWISYPYVVITSKSWVSLSFTALYLPLNFLFLEWLLSHNRSKYALLLALAKGALFLSGAAQQTFMLVLFEIIYIFIRYLPSFDSGFIKKNQMTIILYCLSTLFFLIIIIPLFLPMQEVVSLSFARSKPLSFGEFIAFPVNFTIFLKAQLFTFYPRVIFDYPSQLLHVGVFSLGVLLILVFKSVRERAKRFKAIQYLILAVIAFLLGTSLHGYLYQFSLFNHFRNPHKYFIFFVFFFTVSLSGVGQTLSVKKNKFIPNGILLVFLLALVLNILVIKKSPNMGFYPEKVHVPPDSAPLEGLNKEMGRIMTFNISAPLTDDYKFLTFMHATSFDLFHFGGYNSMLSRLNYNLTYGLYYRNVYMGNMSQRLLDHLSEWSVRYILTSDTKAMAPFEQLVQVSKVKNLAIYENTGSRPYVYDITQGYHPVPFEFRVNSLLVHPVNLDSHELVISLAPLPNYHYFIDGADMGALPAVNGPIRLKVPANTRTVEIKYIDARFVVGFSLFVVFWCSFILCYVVRRARHKNTRVKRV